MNEYEIREEICRAGRSLFDRGYVHAGAGSISVRTSDGYLVTPADASLGALHPNRMARADYEGRQQEGEPAGEILALHRRIQEVAPAASCLLHTRSTNLVGIALSGVWHRDDILPPITPYYVMRVGHLPLVDYRRPGDPETAELIAQTIARMEGRGTPIHAVMLDRIGPLVWDDSLAAATATLAEMEETARLWSNAWVKPSPLSEAQIQELRAAFQISW